MPGATIVAMIFWQSNLYISKFYPSDDLLDVGVRGRGIFIRYSLVSLTYAVPLNSFGIEKT